MVIMAEFCPECFIKLYPELSRKDLIIIKEPDLCEGCGKIVDETVLKVKPSSENKIRNRK
jgi:hypothetical protein